MVGSRRHGNGRKGRTGAAERGDPSKEHPSVARFATKMAGDIADPFQVVELLPLFVDVVAALHGLPSERCADDCAVLVHAYARVGIRAEVRVAVLRVRDILTGESSVYGELIPRWEDGLLHGHTVVWLPDLSCLIDVTAEQYPEVAELREGPVIARPEHPTRTSDSEVRLRVRHQRARLSLTYVLAPLASTALVLDHPVMLAEDAEHRLRGANLASALATAMADSLPSESFASIPYPEVVTLMRNQA